MKLFIFLIVIIFLNNCSFDNKSGIWNNKSFSSNENNQFKNFKNLAFEKNVFNKVINIQKDFKFKSTKLVLNNDWKDVYYNNNNNFPNFKYNDLNEIIFRSKKLSSLETDNLFLFINDHVIISDRKGNLIIKSIIGNKRYTKFNFYKKRHKKINKYLNLVAENDIIYVSDNIGYLYAFDYKNEKVVWAKDYNVPFRSNLKIFKNKLITSNINNELIYIDKNSGNTLRKIPTEETTIKNQFINNIAQIKNLTLYLNTYGSLYSIDSESMRINWLINLNQSLDLSPRNLFFGNQIVSKNNKIVVSSNKTTYVIDKNNGKIIFQKNFSSILKPVILNDYIFFITNNNLLISVNNLSGKIIYSYDINQSIADFLKSKKKNVTFKSFLISNNKILIFLENSYLLIFNLNGTLEEIKKLPYKINSDPIIVKGSIIYLDRKNKIINLS